MQKLPAERAPYPSVEMMDVEVPDEVQKGLEKIRALDRLLEDKTRAAKALAKQRSQFPSALDFVSENNANEDSETFITQRAGMTLMGLMQSESADNDARRAPGSVDSSDDTPNDTAQTEEKTENDSDGLSPMNPLMQKKDFVQRNIEVRIQFKLMTRS